MGSETTIEWCHKTFNPWIGCTKVSEGCANCYAEKNIRVKLHGIEWGKGKERVRTSDAYWNEPRKWNRRCEKTGVRERVFCASLADVFDDEVSIDWLTDLLVLIELTPHLDWLLLTKRPELILGKLERIEEHWMSDRIQLPNVWLGFSAENQRRFDDRIDDALSACHDFGFPVLFCSAEPLLGPITMRTHSEVPSWVIIGGESGPKARPMEVAWAESLVAESRARGASPFVKQLGSRLGLKHKKGGDPSEWPEHLRVREFPNGELSPPPRSQPQEPEPANSRTADPEGEGLCLTCGKNAAEPMHKCPYKDEMRADLTPCNCCSDCEADCRQEI